MKRSITLQIDGDALDALLALETAGMSRSEAIRKALVDAAANLVHRSPSVEPAPDPDSERDGTLAAAKLMETLHASR